MTKRDIAPVTGYQMRLSSVLKNFSTEVRSLIAKMAIEYVIRKVKMVGI